MMTTGSASRYLGGRVAAETKAQGRSLRWVARQLGCSVTNIYNLDSAHYQPKAEFMRAAASLLGVAEGDLFFFSPDSATLLPRGHQTDQDSLGEREEATA